MSRRDDFLDELFLRGMTSRVETASTCDLWQLTIDARLCIHTD